MDWFRISTAATQISPASAKKNKPVVYKFKTMICNNKDCKVTLPDKYDVGYQYTYSNGKVAPAIIEGKCALRRKPHRKSNGLVITIPNDFRRIREWTIAFKVRFLQVRPMSSLIDFGDWSMGFALINSCVRRVYNFNNESLYPDYDLHEVVLTCGKINDDELNERGIYYRTILYVDSIGNILFDDYISMPDKLKFLSTDDQMSCRDMDGYIDDIFISNSGDTMDDSNYEYRPYREFLLKSYPKQNILYDAVNGGIYSNTSGLPGSGTTYPGSGSGSGSTGGGTTGGGSTTTPASNKGFKNSLSYSNNTYLNLSFFKNNAVIISTVP